LQGGTLAAAWPFIADELSLSYAQIGLALAVPALVGTAVEPLLGAAGDTPRRRSLILYGGGVFAAAGALVALAAGFWLFVAALVIAYTASTAFVSLSQASLMDLQPHARELNMARWTLAGSVGVVAGPLLLAAAVVAGAGWRGALLVPAAAAALVVALVRRCPISTPDAHESLLSGIRGAVVALRRREVLRWLAVLEASDLMLDVLHGFLALYLVDVAGLGALEAGLAVGVWTGAGLAGDALLVPLLARVRGLAYLRASAAAVTLVYPALLLAPGAAAKIGLLAVLGLLNAGWYAIPKARLYGALPGRSGTAIAVGSAGGFAAALIPLALGAVADRAGLAPTMWLLVASPLLLLALVPRSRV
jgi:MFS transporter, FSR family, fosmidomycin resistance protein